MVEHVVIMGAGAGGWLNRLSAAGIAWLSDLSDRLWSPNRHQVLGEG